MLIDIEIVLALSDFYHFLSKTKVESVLNLSELKMYSERDLFSFSSFYLVKIPAFILSSAIRF